MTDLDAVPPRRFLPLDQADYQRLDHGVYLKGLLKPFKGKGPLETWASQCDALRAQVVALAQRRVLAQAHNPPLRLLPLQLAQQTTGASTSLLRWRSPDHARMGLPVWQDTMLSPATPARLVADLYAVELDRIVLNMQVSLLRTLRRQALECASKMAQAEAVYQQRVRQGSAPFPITPPTESP